MRKYLIIIALALAATPTFAGVKSKLVQSFIKGSKEQSKNVDLFLSSERQITDQLWLVHLNLKENNTIGTTGRAFFDKFSDGSSIDVTMRVDLYRKTKATILQIELNGVDKKSELLAELSTTAHKYSSKRNGTITLQYIVPEDGVDAKLSQSLARYYADELIVKDLVGTWLQPRLTRKLMDSRVERVEGNR